MADALRKILITVASQAPLVAAAIAAPKDFMSKHLWISVLAGAFYEITVGVLAFGKDMLRILRERASLLVADWVWDNRTALDFVGAIMNMSLAATGP